MRVDLGFREGDMPKKLLHHIKVYTSMDKASCECVSEIVEPYMVNASFLPGCVKPTSEITRVYFCASL